MARSKVITLGSFVVSGTDITAFKQIQRTHDDVGALHINLTSVPTDLAGTLTVSGQIGVNGDEVAIFTKNLASVVAGEVDIIVQDVGLLPDMRFSVLSGAGTGPVTITIFVME